MSLNYEFLDIQTYADIIFNENKERVFVLDNLQKRIAKKLYVYNLEDLNEYDVYSDGILLGEIVERFEEIIKKKLDCDLDYIVGLGQSGIPLALLLSQKLNVKLLVLNEKAHKLPNSRDIIPSIEDANLTDKNVILCDSIVKSGFTAYQHSKILRERGVKQQFLISIVFNHSFFNIKISDKLKFVKYCPLLIWNDDFKESFSKPLIPDHISTNLMSNRRAYIRKLENYKFKSSLLAVVVELKRNIEKDFGQIIPDILSKVNNLETELFEQKDHNYNACRLIFTEFIKFLRNNGYELSQCLYSNYYAFTENNGGPDGGDEGDTSAISQNQNQFVPSTQGPQDSIKNEERKVALDNIIQFQIRDIKSNMFQEYYDFDNRKIRKNYIDEFLFLVLLKHLNSEGSVSSTYISSLTHVIKELKNHRIDPLFSLFRDYCFKKYKNKNINQLEILISKTLFSFFEDFFYSKRYLKNNERINEEFEEYINLCGDFLIFLKGNLKGGYRIYEKLKLFYNLLSNRFTINLKSPATHYFVPNDIFDSEIFFEGLFNLTKDFDEWRLYSNPIALKTICYKFAREIHQLLGEEYYNKTINFFALGMSGIPIGYITQKILIEDYGYEKIKTIFINDKIITPLKQAIKNDKSFLPNENPIFIFDSIIKTGFTKHYLSRIIETSYIDFINMKNINKYFVIITDLDIFHYDRYYHDLKDDLDFTLIQLYNQQKFKKEIYLMRSEFWRNFNIWLFDKVILDKSVYSNLQKCKECEKLINIVEFKYFKELKGDYSNWFKNTTLKQNQLKFCEICEILYIVEEDRKKIEFLQKKIRNMHIF